MFQTTSQFWMIKNHPPEKRSPNMKHRSSDVAWDIQSYSSPTPGGMWCKYVCFWRQNALLQTINAVIVWLYPCSSGNVVSDFISAILCSLLCIGCDHSWVGWLIIFDLKPSWDGSPNCSWSHHLWAHIWLHKKPRLVAPCFGAISKYQKHPLKLTKHLSISPSICLVNFNDIKSMVSMASYGCQNPSTCLWHLLFWQ